MRPAHALAPIVLASLAAGASVGHATTYKWVDDKGVVHYSDRVPPEAANKSRVELNPQGVPVKKSERPPTPEQVKASEQERARMSAADKQREEIARRDRALLSSYTTERDIDLARDRALRTIEAVVQSAEAYAVKLEGRKAEAEAKKAGYAGKPVPAAIERELEAISVESAQQAELIARKKREAESVRKKYEADKERWRELVAAKGSAVAPAPGATAAAGGVPVESSSVPAGGRK
jgi:hypothetical protein